MIAALGRQDRGTKTNPELAVLRLTSMPAIIVEGAFLSNPDDLKLMLTKGYGGNYAMAIAKAIITELNNSIK
ncbi:MAG TPA: N-acetylmuramoyl-L-alanine amidase [Anaerovoracaceae bacterium]|nr:N-acetylmuramoyl-L-alanine amidase [Anaerovoracaceae bacterium]